MVVFAVPVAWAAPELALTAEQQDALDHGETVWGLRDRQAWGARVVEVAEDTAWDPILDCASYVDTFPYVTRSEDVDGACAVSLTTRGITTRYTLDSAQNDGWVEFDAAPVGRGLVRGATGWWRVEPWRGDPNRSLVTYTLAVDPLWGVPDWVGGIAARRVIPLVLDAVDRRIDRLRLTAAR